MAKKKPAAPKEIDWGNVLDSLQSGSGDWLFVKPGKTRLRLLQSPQDALPFTEVTTSYRGNTRTKFMILAYDGEAEEQNIQGLVIPKTAFKALTAMLADGFDFFHPTEGYGITILKTGSGFGTEYSVLPSKRALPVPAPVQAELAGMSVVALGIEFTTQQANRTETGGGTPDNGGPDQEPAPMGADW